MAMRRDTLLHLAVSASLALGFHAVGVSKRKAAVYAIMVGVSREALQRQGAEGWHDMKANAVGVAVGLSVPWR
jgi:hypothetical protein